jgi:TPR repeat protein
MASATRNRWRRSCCAWSLALLAVLPQGASAGPYEDGLALYEAGQYRRAYETWLPLAEAGDCRAQFGVGEALDLAAGMYRGSRPKPSKEDRRWCENLFVSCRTYAQDAAHYWRYHAAKQGHAEAQRHMASYYMTRPEPIVPAGMVFPFFEEGIRWMHLAAENGDAISMWDLSDHYMIEKNSDPVTAYKWVLILREKRELLGMLDWKLEYFARTLTSAQIREAEKQAADWIAAHAKIPSWGPC